jgi:heme exporter protein CcmD
MGDYGFYVWTSYAVFALVLLLDGVIPLLRARGIRRAVVLRQRRDAARKSS